MRIVSLIPGATEILCALGLQDDIVAISHACDWPTAILSRPRVTATCLGADLSSYQINDKVRESFSSGRSLYTVDGELIRSLHPDLVITQEQCLVCAIDRERAICGIDSLDLETKLLSLSACNFVGLYRDIMSVGLATGQTKKAEGLVNQLASRLDDIAQRTSLLSRPRVFCLSWFDPVMAAGVWITEMVHIAGGNDVFGSGNASSSPFAIDRLASQSPEFIFLMPCSFSQERSYREWANIRDLFPWRDLQAVQQGQIFTLESRLFHGLGPCMVEGVELIASLLHPDCCSFFAQNELSRMVA